MLQVFVLITLRIQHEWLDLHKPTEHGLAICYNITHVKIITVYEVVSQLEMLPVLVEVNEEQVFAGLSISNRTSS